MSLLRLFPCGPRKRNRSARAASIPAQRARERVAHAEDELGRLDRRATYTLADRKAQYDAAMRVVSLFGAESALMDRIIALRGEVEARAEQAKSGPLHEQLEQFDARIDAVRKRIVATTEGGAITGEERLREHTDNLYGAILSWDGQPAAYQVERIGVLEGELKDVAGEFRKLLDSELPAVNKALGGAGLPAIEPPPAKVAAATTRRGGGTQAGVEFDADAVGLPAALPTSRIVLH